MDPRDLFLNHYAFLVGIDEYDHFDNLQGAHSDATTLRDALHWVGYPERNIWLVPSARTSLADLHDKIKAFLKAIKKSQKSGHNPDIVVFWAGHGVPGVDGGFLIAQDTKCDSEDWRGCAVSLKWFADRFVDFGPASLTFFFDVCHSVPSQLSDFKKFPRELTLAFMRDAVRTTFVGVSTCAYEIKKWGRFAGILADAVQRAVRGERCDGNDEERCHDDGFAVTDKRLVDKLEAVVNRNLEAVVNRNAEIEELRQSLFVLTHHMGGEPRTIGFAVRAFAKYRLEHELDLPAEADLLARLVVDSMEPCLNHLKVFECKLNKLVRKLIYRQITKDNYLQDEQELVCREILRLQEDEHLGRYIYLLLYCREEAKCDDGAKQVSRKLFNYLLLGGSPEDLGSWLSGRYRTFAIRQALPWSCGIKVLDNNNEKGYAPIIREGEPIVIDMERTFVTTAQLQRKARIEVYRRRPEASEDICHTTIGRFSREMPRGARVWVRIGLDVQNCVDENDERGSCQRRYDGLSVPMRIMLGREGHRDCDWQEHWHLELAERWPTLRDSEPSWAMGLRILMNECAESLEALLIDDEATRRQKDGEAGVLIKWLYLADVMMRMLDESRLEYVVLELIAAW